MFEDKIAESVLEWKNDKRCGPFEVQFNPTNRCNLKCKFCWLRDFDEDKLNHEELSTKKYKEIIKDCSKMKVHTIEISGGGEPFMRNDILAIMKAIKDSNIFGRIVTNGTLLTEESIKKLVKMGWDEIIFSLDAPNKEVNDYLRGKSFDRIVEVIKNIQTRKIESKIEKPMVNIHMVLCNKNFHLLPNMFDFVYNLNCKNLLVEPIVLLATKTNSGSNLLFAKKDEKPLLRYIGEATKIAHEHKFQTNIDNFRFNLIESTSKMKGIIKEEGRDEENYWASLPCYQPFYHMVLRPWGTAGPCCMFDNIGENIEEKHLKEIWLGEQFKEVRKKIMDVDLPDFCSKCNPSQVQENRKIREYIKNFSG